MATVDLRFWDGTEWVSVGDVVPDASTTTKGIIQIADAASITAGTALLAVDAAGLKTATDLLVKKAGDTMTGPLQIIAGGPRNAAIKFADGAGIYQPGAKQLGITTKDDGSPSFIVSPDSVVAWAGLEAKGTVGVGTAAPAKTASAFQIGGPATELTGGVYHAILNTASVKGTASDVAGVQNQVGFVNATVGTYRGIVQSNPTAAFYGTTTVGLYEGFYVSALSPSLDSVITEARSIHVAMNDSATAIRYNIYADGSAPNYFGGQVRTGSGVQAYPAISFRGDEDTGIYRPADNAWAVATGGVERFQVDATGELLSAASYTPTKPRSLATKQYVDDAASSAVGQIPNYQVISTADYAALSPKDPHVIYLVTDNGTAPNAQSLNTQVITRATYDALSPKDPHVLYLIKG